MCGEMAGDIAMTIILLGLGLDEFSTSPIAIPEIKRIIRSVTVRQAKETLGQARLAVDSQRIAVRAAIATAWGEPASPARLPGPRAGLAATLLVALPLALLFCLGVWMPGPFRGALERCAAVLNGSR